MASKWKGHNNNGDKSYPGDNRLISPKSPYIDRSFFGTSMSAHHPCWAEVGPKGGWAVRPLKWYVSWVQNVVRQFGPIHRGRKEIRGLLLVREDPVDGPLVYNYPARYSWVATSGTDKR